ncbi:MAG: TIM barrel protein [Pirellulales bacterium]
MVAKRNAPAPPAAEEKPAEPPKTKLRDAPLVALTLVIGLVVGTGWYLREQTREKLTQRGDYRLELREIELNPPPPEWIRSDLRAEALRDASLDAPLSTLDSDLPEKLRRAFSLHPWIREVQGVTIDYPAAARIEVEYRRPIAMVEVARGLLPIDAQGVLLPPRDFDHRDDVRDYPRIVGALGGPTAAVGTVWKDDVVAAGAALARLLSPIWSSGKFARLRWLDDSQDLSRVTRYFLLETRDGGLLIWGQAPGREHVGEPSAADKAAALQAWVAAPGGIDAVAKAASIDLRDRRHMAATTVEGSSPNNSLENRMPRSSISVCLLDEAHGGPFVLHDDLPTACRQASELGFDAIELMIGGPDEIPAHELKTLLATYRLELSAVMTGGGWVKQKLSLTSPQSNEREAAQAFVRKMIDYGAELGASAIIGSMQGRHGDGVDRSTAFGYLGNALKTLGEHASQYGLPLLYEPINRYESNLCNRLDEATDLLAGLDRPNVRVLADLFHMSIEEADPAAAIRAAGSWIGHVHLADSNRRAAGMGHMSYPPLIAALNAIGFDGYVAAEVFPLPDARSAAEQAIVGYRRWFEA